jgi:WD40 repeat protein
MNSGEILQGVVRQLREQLGGDTADAELLARHAGRRDEAAFAVLVRRYGGLVFGLACRQLPDRHEAEDVFQATFLALAQGEAHIWNAVTGKHLRGLNMSWQRMALSPDGRHLAWLVADTAPHQRSRIRLYDLAAGRQLADFPASTGDGHYLFFSPDSKRLLTVDRGSGVVRLWDVAARKELRTFRATPADGGGLWRTAAWTSALSPDAKVLAVGYHRADPTTALSVPVPVRLWDVATGKELHEVTGHRNQVDDLAFSPDGRLLASCDGRNTFVWDVATGRREPRLPAGLPGGASSVAFSCDGRMLAPASGGGPIRLWEVATWGQRTTLPGHRDGVLALHFAADGRLYSGSPDTTVLAWDVYRRPATDATPK